LANLSSEDEEVFATHQVKYYGQAVGLIVADTKVIHAACSSLFKQLDFKFITTSNCEQNWLKVETSQT
jgi:xanthine dehydrogenase molybdopterin-binding subunit B